MKRAELRRSVRAWRVPFVRLCRCFGFFTMDVIASVAFATQVDSQNKPDDPFVHHAQMFFTFSFFRPMMMFFSKSLSRFTSERERSEVKAAPVSCLQLLSRPSWLLWRDSSQTNDETRWVISSSTASRRSSSRERSSLQTRWLSLHYSCPGRR